MSDAAPLHATGGHLRRFLIVSVLVAALIGLHRLGAPTGGIDPTGMLAFGFVVLASYTFGELVGIVRLPHITGYVIAGILLGPSLAHTLPHGWIVPPPFDRGVLNEDVIGQFRQLGTLAIALIALTAGGEMDAAMLRKSALQIAGIVGGLLFAWPAIAAALFLGFGPLHLLDLPGYSDQPEKLALLCAVVAVVVAATSPSVTIAILNSTGAKGPASQLVMTSVVAMDVLIATLFSVMVSVTGARLGLTEGGTDLLRTVAAPIGGSMALGGALGLVLALYLRYVGAEVLLFLVGAVYTAGLAVAEWHLEPILVFIAAGFAVANFSRQGETLIKAVAQLGMPTYVVFFTLAGAALHLDTLVAMAPLTAGVFLVRGALFFVGVQVGGMAAGVPPNIRKYAWLGFVSQAGVAIGLAQLVGRTYGEAGNVMATLIISVISVNELVGPTLFKAGLGAMGEIPGVLARGERSRKPTLDTAIPTDGTWAAGGDALAAAGGDVDKALDQAIGPATAELLGRVAGDAAWLRAFPQVAWRAWRTEAPERRTIAIAEAWRELLVARAVKLEARDGVFVGLSDAFDRVVDVLPEQVDGTWPASADAIEPTDGWLVAARKRLGRTDRAIRARLGRPRPRPIPLRVLGRFHLSGELVGALEHAAAGAIAAELAVHGVVSGWITSIHGPPPSTPQAAAPSADEPRIRLRDEVERARLRLVQDALVVNTAGLPAWHRRFGRVYQRRIDGLERVGPGLDRARAELAARYRMLALDLELRGFVARAREGTLAVAAGLAGPLATDVRAELARVDAAVTSARERIAGDAGLAIPEADAVRKVVDAAVTAIARVRGEVRGERALSGPIDAAIALAADRFERANLPGAAI
jgi:Kef-type K+ transport system membrane component KefB